MAELMGEPRVYADLNKRYIKDGELRAFLTTLGTHEDMRFYGITFAEGLFVKFWDSDGDDQGREDPLLFEGTMTYDTEQEAWAAIVDETTYRHARG